MPKRVAVFGTESTGKSALAAALAEHFGEPWASEYVRWFWDDRAGTILPTDLSAIARGQIANEETAAAAADRVVFCDTDLLMNVRWADELFPGHCPGWLRGAADTRSRDYALYLYCEPDLPWAEDPQRSFRDAAAWRESASRCLVMLEERRLPWVRISGQGADRFEMAKVAVDAILAG